jgi:hypothetical protein
MSAEVDGPAAKALEIIKLDKAAAQRLGPDGAEALGPIPVPVRGGGVGCGAWSARPTGAKYGLLVLGIVNAGPLIFGFRPERSFSLGATLCCADSGLANIIA